MAQYMNLLTRWGLKQLRKRSKSNAILGCKSEGCIAATVKYSATLQTTLPKSIREPERGSGDRYFDDQLLFLVAFFEIVRSAMTDLYSWCDVLDVRIDSVAT